MTHAEPKPILVTGSYRSGTTVVEKMLNMHHSITVASQPFPILYFMLKERFNHHIGIKRRYPLDHLFLEDAYTAKQLYTFLHLHILDSTALSEFKLRMAEYKTGLWTPEILDTLHKLVPGSFFDVYTQLNQRIASIFPAPCQSYIGGKEILVEEFTLPLIDAGTTVIFVIRDPRAMIASLNFPQRDNYTGNLRPVLYNLRVWRKGVAFALAASQRKPDRAYLVRYEDLVSDGSDSINDLTDFLSENPHDPDAFTNGITDQYGRTWTGNSSFTDKSGISSNSIEAYVDRLPPQVQLFIESVCTPEMQLFGYTIESSPAEQDKVLSTYRDPFKVAHNCFSPGYSHDNSRVSAERNRKHLLQDGLISPAKQSKWFITREAYSMLRAAYS